VPGSGRQVGDPVMNSPYLAGIHFTGSTPVFQNMWKTVGDNIAKYKSYPRIVGETGGKDFIFVHKSAEVKEVNTALIRGSFEYQGQKCSAASRAYVPQSMWNSLKKLLVKDAFKQTFQDAVSLHEFREDIALRITKDIESTLEELVIKNAQFKIIVKFNSLVRQKNRQIFSP